MEVAVASGVFGDGYQVVKSGIRKVSKWFDRARGLSLLKKLPTGLEALVFGEDDVTPELLAALSLGGRPGLQLSTIALLKAYDLGLFPRNRLGGSTPNTVAGWDREKLVEMLFHVETEPLCRADSEDRSRMDGKTRQFHGIGSKFTFIRHLQVLPPDASLSLDGNTCVRVVAYADSDAKNKFFPDGLVVVDENGLGYYCENVEGHLRLSSCDVDTFNIHHMLGPEVFVVAPAVLENHGDFRRLCFLLGCGEDSIAKLLGLQKVAKDLGEQFVRQITDGEIPLLSFEHLQNVHHNIDQRAQTLQMPTETELRTRVEEASESLSLLDRDAALVLFSDSMQEIVSGFVKTVESEAARRGNVGVRPYEWKKESDVIRSAIVQAVGMDATFAIFEGFRKHQVNIAVSPRCTAMYFPGLCLTIAFPEGFEVEGRRAALTPACPFSSDLTVSLHILLDLAPKLAQNKLTKFANTLSSELAKDPALALSPVTEAVVRALSPRGRPCEFYLTDLFDYCKRRSPDNAWREASIAGVLCQLGLTFLAPPHGQDLRCFFQVCREVWPSRGSGGAVYVDCGVDISGCCGVRKGKARDNRKCLFLEARAAAGSGQEAPKFILTGEVASVPWNELPQLRQCVGYLHRDDEITPIDGVFGTVAVASKVETHIPVPCHVIGFGRPATE